MNGPYPEITNISFLAKLFFKTFSSLKHLSGYRTVGLSDRRTIGLSDCRTIGLSDYSYGPIFRKDKNGVYIYQLNITPPWVYLAFITSNLIQITWLFAWDREVFIAALVLYVLLSITWSIALVLSVIYLNKNEEKLRNMNMTTEILIIQHLVQASLILYASVIILFTLVNLSIVFTYRGVVTVMWSSTISLIILTSLLINWFVVDRFIIKK
jgi:hypothetical protein